VIQFAYKQRHLPNLKCPKTFNEKIQVLKLTCRDPRLPTLVDKHAVRGFVASRIGAEFLIPLIGCYQNASEIDFNSLPEQFALKANHGSGWNIICMDKSELDWPAAVDKMDRWLRMNFHRIGREWAYCSVPRRIVCEELITDENGNLPNDYKFFCFDGVPRFIQVDLDRFSGHSRNLYDTDWKLLPLEFEYPAGPKDHSAPSNLREMLQIAAKLSAGFPFVRVDLYSETGRTYFGEMTFYPEKGLGRFRPRSYDRIFGDFLDLPQTAPG
jgi:hypothetical protein